MGALTSASGVAFHVLMAELFSILLLVLDAANLDVVIGLFKFKEMPLRRLVCYSKCFFGKVELIIFT